MHYNPWVMRSWKDLETKIRGTQLGHPRFDSCCAKPAPNPRNRDTGSWTPHDKGSVGRMWGLWRKSIEKAMAVGYKPV